MTGAWKAPGHKGIRDPEEECHTQRLAEVEINHGDIR